MMNLNLGRNQNQLYADILARTGSNGDGNGDPKKKGGKLPREGTPANPNAAPLALYKPTSDVTPPKTIQLTDTRQINPVSGQPYKIRGTKGIKAGIDDIKAIVAHAKAQGIDPYNALAIGLQESELGRLDSNYGQAFGVFADAGVGENYNDLNDPGRTRDVYANILAKTLKEKNEYAQNLVKRGVIPNKEEFLLQVYNGLGKLTPRKTPEGKIIEDRFYGVPVTDTNPLDMKKNPAYGKTVIQLREEVIKKNPEIIKLIESTPAYSLPSNQGIAAK